MQVGDLVRLNHKVLQKGTRDFGTVIRVHNDFYCNILWLSGQREWIETKLLEVA